MNKKRITIGIALLLALNLSGCNMIRNPASSRSGRVDSQEVIVTTTLEETTYDEALANTMRDEVDKNRKAGNITYEEANGVIRYLRGTIDSPVNSPEDAVAAIAAVSDLFHIEDFHYHASRVEGSSRNEHAYLVRQLYQGIPVTGGYFEVTTTKDGTVTRIDGIYADVTIDTLEPVITPEEVIAMTEVHNVENPTHCELCIYTYPEGTCTLAWGIYNARGSWADIDALEGNLLDRTQSLFY